MKKSNYTFADGFLGMPSEKKINGFRSFDWEKAATIIKAALKDHPYLIAEAGLQNDWSCTGGIIFENGYPTNDHYTYLSSNWAIPTLILSWDGDEQIEQDCFVDGDDKFNESSKWDDASLSIVGLPLIPQP